jgi:hypothetical protein
VSLTHVATRNRKRHSHQHRPRQPKAAVTVGADSVGN